MLVGADPQPGSDLKARYFFDGLIQQVSVQKLKDYGPAEVN